MALQAVRVEDVSFLVSTIFVMMFDFPSTMIILVALRMF